MQISFAALLKNILTDSGETQYNISTTPKVTLANGSAANQASNGLQSKSRTLASGGSEVLDLYDLAGLDIGMGPGQDNIGLAQANVELVGAVIENVGDAGNDGALHVGGEGSGAAWNAFINSDTAVLIIPKGAAIGIQCGTDPAWAINDVTNHLLKFAAVGGNVKFNIVFIFRNA
jgi:hypothetical protein